MYTLFATVGTLLGVFVTAWVSYLLGRRKNSGKIDTTEAAVLWQESQAMRQELRTEVVDLREQLIEARKEIVSLKVRVQELEKA